jgi:hypothetical protein
VFALLMSPIADCRLRPATFRRASFVLSVNALPSCESEVCASPHLLTPRFRPSSLHPEFGPFLFTTGFC